MKKAEKSQKGWFHSIDSFAIRSRKQFYLIGDKKEGEIKENWFLNVPLNSSLNITVRINSVEEIEHSSEEKYILLIIDCPDRTNSSGDVLIDILMSLGIRNENLPITVEGEDFYDSE